MRSSTSQFIEKRGHSDHRPPSADVGAVSHVLGQLPNDMADDTRTPSPPSAPSLWSIKPRPTVARTDLPFAANHSENPARLPFQLVATSPTVSRTVASLSQSNHQRDDTSLSTPQRNHLSPTRDTLTADLSTDLRRLLTMSALDGTEGILHATAFANPAPASDSNAERQVCATNPLIIEYAYLEFVSLLQLAQYFWLERFHAHLEKQKENEKTVNDSENDRIGTRVSQSSMPANMEFPPRRASTKDALSHSSMV